MGEKLSRIKWEDVTDYIEEQIQEVFNYIDYAARTLVMGYPSKILDWLEYQLWNFNAIMSYDSDRNDNEFCIDKEGHHEVGDTWSSKNRCNRKICVAHDTIKELRCPVMPENHKCSVSKGNPRDPYPQCCDELDCPLMVNPRPLLRPAKPVWWVHENYIHVFSSSSEEELDPHPSTISAKLSGLTQSD